MGKVLVGVGLLVPVYLAFRYLELGALLPALLSIGLMFGLVWAWHWLLRRPK